MSEKDAITSFLVCFSSPTDADHGKPSIKICLGTTPTPDATESDAPSFFFRISLSNVRVHLPNPPPGNEPVVGTTNIAETLALSPQDMRILQQWLSTYAPPSR